MIEGEGIIRVKPVRSKPRSKARSPIRVPKVRQGGAPCVEYSIIKNVLYPQIAACQIDAGMSF